MSVQGSLLTGTHPKCVLKLLPSDIICPINWTLNNNRHTVICVQYGLSLNAFYIRFTNEEDKKWFENCTLSVCKKQIGEEFVSMLHDEPYLVDFLRDAPEPTGDEPDDADMEAPKVYELV